MNAIQITLLCLLAAALAAAWLILKRQLFIRLFFTIQFIAGIAFVIAPDLSTRIAEALGVGRGTDLILYFLVIFVYFSCLCILHRFRQIERRQTLLAREIAIANAKQPDSQTST